MSWSKLGRILSVQDWHPKLLSHAANPVPVWISGNRFRIYFSSRDGQNRSSVGAVDVDICSQEILHEHRTPLASHGIGGTYFADGISLGGCYEAEGVKWMTFMGWSNPPNGHWFGELGRIEIERDGKLKLEDPQVPAWPRSSFGSISLSYPWIMRDPGFGFRMWYGTTRAWDAGNGEMLHVIESAHSRDGVHWIREGLAVPFELGVAQAFSRPTVIKSDDGLFEMWFSYRSGNGTPYRIGYANSHDGKNWKLDLKNSGIDVSTSGWDSQMIEYPYVFVHHGERYMLYNGNEYGRTGFGLAVWKTDK